MKAKCLELQQPCLVDLSCEEKKPKSLLFLHILELACCFNPHMIYLIHDLQTCLPNSIQQAAAISGPGTQDGGHTSSPIQQKAEWGEHWYMLRQF